MHLSLNVLLTEAADYSRAFGKLKPLLFSKSSAERPFIQTHKLRNPRKTPNLLESPTAESVRQAHQSYNATPRPMRIVPSRCPPWPHLCRRRGGQNGKPTALFLILSTALSARSLVLIMSNPVFPLGRLDEFGGRDDVLRTGIKRQCQSEPNRNKKDVIDPFG